MGACAGTSISKKGKRGNLQSVRLQEASLVCDVCTLEYKLQDREPIMLCINQHNCCRTCVDRILNSEQPSCPFCRLKIEAALLTRNRILIEILEENAKKTNIVVIEKQVPKEQTPQQKLQRILQQARSFNLQKVIYHIESGVDLSTVKQLHLWNSQLPRIIDLSLFTGLMTLDLHKNMITDIDHLQNLTELAFLNLGYNQISVIKNLNSLQKLQFLDLCHNHIEKIENLSSCASLTTLNLSNNSITMIENMYQLKRLAILYLKMNPIDLKSSIGSIQALKYRGVVVEIGDMVQKGQSKRTKTIIR